MWHLQLIPDFLAGIEDPNIQTFIGKAGNLKVKLLHRFWGHMIGCNL